MTSVTALKLADAMLLRLMPAKSISLVGVVVLVPTFSPATVPANPPSRPPEIEELVRSRVVPLVCAVECNRVSGRNRVGDLQDRVGVDPQRQTRGGCPHCAR